ncbi:MAG: hypothetical protein ACKPEY_04585, partial [Planctomycetota bacterium]
MSHSTKHPQTTPDTTGLQRLALAGSAVIEIVAAADPSAPAPLPRFRMVAYTGGPMRVAGWRYPVILDLAGLAIPSQSRPIRFGHDPLSGVGHTDSIRIDQGQLIATGIVSRDTSAAREVVTSSKNGFPWQASVGTSVEDFEFVKENQQVMVNGQQYSGPINVVRKATLGEISFVDLGADGATSATVAAGANTHRGEPSVDEPTRTEDTATQSGTNTTVAAAAAPTAPSVAPAVTAAAATATTPERTAAQIREEAVAETNRIAAVRRQCAGRFPQIEAQAI